MTSNDHKNTAVSEPVLRSVITISGIVAAYVILRCVFYRFFDFFRVNHEYAQDAALVFIIAAYIIGRVVVSRKERK